MKKVFWILVSVVSCFFVFAGCYSDSARLPPQEPKATVVCENRINDLGSDNYYLEGGLNCDVFGDFVKDNPHLVITTFERLPDQPGKKRLLIGTRKKDM